MYAHNMRYVYLQSNIINLILKLFRIYYQYIFYQYQQSTHTHTHTSCYRIILMLDHSLR